MAISSVGTGLTDFSQVNSGYSTANSTQETQAENVKNKENVTAGEAASKTSGTQGVAGFDLVATYGVTGATAEQRVALGKMSDNSQKIDGIVNPHTPSFVAHTTLRRRAMNKISPSATKDADEAAKNSPPDSFANKSKVQRAALNIQLKLARTIANQVVKSIQQHRGA